MIALLSMAIMMGSCAPESNRQGELVPVNLTLILDHHHGSSQSRASRLVSFIERWMFGVSPAWAQAVTEIATIQVHIFGPDLPTPPSVTVPVSDPTSGQVIPISIQAPVGPNRTISVAAFDAEGRKIFSGSSGVTELVAGQPNNLEITLAPTFIVTVQKQGAGSGTVSSSPPGIDCGGTCAAPFDAGTSVSLSAAAAPLSTFVGWNGGGCSGTGACLVSGTATVTAVFETAVSTESLTVTKSGTGTGTVTSNPSGISCGDGCSANFASGSPVVLTAAPSGGSTFTGWSGACSGTETCTLVMNGNQTVNAEFTAAPATAVLSVMKTGNGTVTSSPAGINCGETCSFAFTSGSVVRLTAAPIGGATFVGWSGGGCSGTGACDVVMNGNQTVTATFVPPPSMATLTVTTEGTGTGTVSSAPGGINNCAGTCTAEFPEGTPVTLTATATGGGTFTGWGGACAGIDPCVLPMNGNQSVSAQFTAPPNTVTLTVLTAGTGTGAVNSTPPGITNCTAACNANFVSGTIVTLTATPSGGSTFGGWSGGGCNGIGSCQVAMTANTTVTAIFNPPANPSTLSVVVTGTGTGVVTSSPPGIDCGTTCVAIFASGTSVTLTATPAEGSTFVGWSGGCVGTAPCVIVLSDNQTVVAQFDANPNLAVLTVTKSGSGSGTVTSSPPGIDCGITCLFSFAVGTLVTLTAVADNNSEFERWRGSGCTGDGLCMVMMNGNRSVDAEFDDD